MGKFSGREAIPAGWMNLELCVGAAKGASFVKVLYIITLPDLGGAQVHLLALATEMQARGHKVAVAVGCEGWLTEKPIFLFLSYGGLSGKFLLARILER